MLAPKPLKLAKLPTEKVTKALIVYGLVYADSEDEALEIAESEVFTPLTERETFDSYWAGEELADGLLPDVAIAESRVERELVEYGWQKTASKYKTNFEQVQQFLDDHDVSGFWTDRDVHQRYGKHFRSIGSFEGPTTYLYDGAGQGIRTRDHLEALYNRWEEFVEEGVENPLLDKNLYVVPCEVEY